MSRIRKSTIIVSVLAIVMMILPAAAGAAPLSQGESYTVQKDDSLWAIAEKYLGNGAAYAAVVVATNAEHETDSSFAKIDDPSLIQPGWKILIPGAEEAAKLLVEELPPDAAPPDQQVLTVYATEGKSLDMTVVVYTRQYGVSLLFEPLVRIDKNYETLPGSGCAESWEVAEDGLTWTFHIYPGLEWSDGTPFTAHDIEWSCKRQADPETGYESPFNFYQIKNFEESILGEVSPDEVGCEAIDDTTFQVVTEKPLPFLPLMLGEMWFAPRHVVEEVGETWSLSPETFVGNGPYTLEEWDRGNRLVFKRNTNYKGPMKPYLEKIIFKIAEPEAMFPAYLAGDNEAIVREYKTYLSPADKKRMETDPELSKELHQFNRMQTYWIAFGEKDCVFKDPKVRQAFMHGVTDREGIIASALGGMGTPGYGMLPSGFHCADQERLKDIQAYDPELAKELLAEAGYPNGEGFPELDLYLRDEPPTTVAAAEAIAALAKANLGVTLSVSNLEKKTYIDKMFADEMCIYLIPWGMDYYDAFNFIQIYSTGFRHPWSNEEYDNLFNAANTEFDPEKRCELYQEAEEILVSEPGAIFMWYPVVRQTWKTYIKGPGVEPNKYGDRLWQDPKHGQTYFQVYIAEH